MRRPFPGISAGLFVFMIALFDSTLTAQSTWTGASSSSWSLAGNWSGIVPQSTTNVTIPAGTPNAPSTSGVANATCNNLTIASGATVTIASGFPLTSNGVVAVSGTIAGGGVLRLGGSSVSDMTASGPLTASLEIVKSAGGSARIASNVTVTGNLTQTSGDFTVSIGTFTLAVGGNAVFQGGTLSISSFGTIDVAGNVTFSGTSATGNSPSIQCGGNWTSDANYAPSNASVTLDKSGAQTVSAAGILPSVTIAQSSSTTSSAALHVQGLTVNGALTTSPGALDVDGNFTLASTGSLTLGNATNTFGGAMTVNGALSATGTLVMDGSSIVDLVASAALPSLQIAKTAGGSARIASNVTLTGNLTQTSGDLTVSIGTFTLAVGGNAVFQGGTLSISSFGTIDVAGNVTFSGTTATGNSPTIQCGGNWTSDANYSPTTASVTLDKTGAQTVSVAGILPTVIIAQSSSTTSSGGLHVRALTVNGALTTSPGALDVDNDFALASTGSLTLGNATNTFGGAMTMNGALSATGTLVMDGSSIVDVVASAVLPSLQISKTAGGSARIASNVTLTGNLTQTSGDLTVSIGTFTLAVGGNAVFQGGTLSISSFGTIDVAGSVSFSGTSVSGNAPTIRCAGNWTSDASFTPGNQLVELDGTSSTSIAHAVAGGTVTFANLTLKNGTRTLANDFTLAAQTVTIDPSGALQVASGRHLRVHRSGPTSFNVNGALSVASNAELSMGPQTSATIAGSLSLVGTAAQPAKITGEAGGGYGLTVTGALAAKDFLVKEMGPGGLVVDFPATIAAAPNNFRNGTFDFRTGAAAGSVLLDIRRNTPAVLDQLTFLNTVGASSVFNVTTSAASLPVSLTNWTGAFAGPSFESDPNGLITWNTQAPPALQSFTVAPGAELATLVWHMTSETGVSGYQIRRASSAAGPFPVVLSAPAGLIHYGLVDQPLAANQPAFYLLYATMATGGESVLLGNGSATPYSSAPPPNVYKVGPGAPFATIQAAINAATASNSVVWVTPGTYASFSIGASAPSNLHVIGDGATPITIDTSSGPIQIANVPGAGGIELSNLVVGNAATAQDGIVVTSCACPVVLDQVAVSCNGAHAAVQVSASPATAIQRCAIQGGTGLSVTAGAHVAISRGSLSSLVSTGSTIEMTNLIPGSVSVTPPSSLVTHAGLMPDLNLPELAKLTLPGALFLDAFPNAPFIVIAAPRMGFTNVNPFEMPVLVDSLGMVQLPILFTDSTGQAAVGFNIPPDAALLGFTYVVQVGAFNASINNWRFSNVETMVAMP